MDIKDKEPVKSLAARPFIWVERVGNAHPAFYYTLPLTVCVVTIMIASLLPSRDIPKIHLSDKLVHGAMYAGLGWLMLRAWVRDRHPTGTALLIVAGICSMWGFYLECLQGLTPDRGFELVDEASNILGAVAGTALWLGWLRIFNRFVA